MNTNTGFKEDLTCGFPFGFVVIHELLYFQGGYYDIIRMCAIGRWQPTYGHVCIPYGFNLFNPMFGHDMVKGGETFIDFSDKFFRSQFFR